MTGGIFLTVICGDDSRLCHGDDVPAYRDRRGSMGVQEFLRGVVVLFGRSTRNRSCWTLWSYGTRRWSRIGSLCQLLREPQGSLAHGLSLHCSCTCAAETRSTHPRSLLQDRHAWSHLLRAVPVLLSHHWPSTCSRVACCLARAHACGIEPSRPSVLRRASDPRRAAPASTSAWVEGARRA
jgi:hypothetical protein